MEIRVIDTSMVVFWTPKFPCTAEKTEPTRVSWFTFDTCTTEDVGVETEAGQFQNEHQDIQNKRTNDSVPTESLPTGTLNVSRGNSEDNCSEETLAY